MHCHISTYDYLDLTKHAHKGDVSLQEEIVPHGHYLCVCVCMCVPCVCVASPLQLSSASWICQVQRTFVPWTQHTTNHSAEFGFSRTKYVAHPQPRGGTNDWAHTPAYHTGLHTSVMSELSTHVVTNLFLLMYMNV